MRHLAWNRLLIAAAALAVIAAPATAQTIPATGREVPEMAPVERFITGLMAKYQIPGASVAVTRNGKLVLARGYGYADRDANELVQPDSLFRQASDSKAITAIAILKLWDEGKIDLDAKAFSYLPDLRPLPGATVDPRLSQITVRHLLNHTGGWDRDTSFDPMFRSRIVVMAVGSPAPNSTEDIIRYMFGQPLQYDPGTKYAYSNYGYAILGRIIERITGMTYEAYVRTRILAPMGIDRMRIGHSVLEGRVAGEVMYYMPPGTALAPTVFTLGPAGVPRPYGSWYMESMDAHGGWIASAMDMLRLHLAVDGHRGTRLLSANAMRQFTLKPAIAEYTSASSWYGMGVAARASGTDFTWWHNGLLDGVITYVVRLANGWAWTLMLNIRTAEATIFGEIDTGINTALGQSNPPATLDLFSNYPDAVADGPVVTAQDGVLHGATFQRGIVPGSWATIRGGNLSSAARAWTGADIVGDKLPESLDGVSVKVNGKAASVYYISPYQINYQVPADIAAGWAKVEVTRNGKTSSPVLAEMRANAPGFFQYAADGRTFAVAVHLDSAVVGDAAKVPGTRFAQSGQRLLLFGTGFVASPAGTVLAAPIPVTVPVTIRFGTTQAVVEGTALIGPGLFQSNIVTPPLPDGDYEVTVEVNGRRSPAGVIIPIRN